jgi:hypothetical protein
VRWSAPLVAGLLFLLWLALELGLRLLLADGGYISMIAVAFGTNAVRDFVVGFSLQVMVPFYLAMGLWLWAMTLLWGNLWQRGWSGAWRFRESVLLTTGALLWAHLLLWWEVPSTLWVLPGLNALPFWLLLPLLLAASVAYPLVWSWRQGRRRGLAPVLLGWLGLWAVPAWLPGWLPRILTPAAGGDDPTEVLMVGLDGLRADVGLENTTGFVGTAYAHAYTPVPSTRLLWHILWGGDPLYYTVGHAPPAKEELGVGEAVPLPLLEAAKELGWRPRYYIDDAGTIGLLGREDLFDDVLVPGRGWESFLGSNVSVSFPLFAAWENWARAFPTTNPWAPLDVALREALKQGRGSKWVMFHSCLAHQPVYLRRFELEQVPGWWWASPGELEPITTRRLVTQDVAQDWDERFDPKVAYEIRMASILRVWQPIWNGLAEDPSYANAVRILFSDHGERFYPVGDRVRLQGVHGFNLDPWEMRVTLKVAGPGFVDTGAGAPEQRTVSLLALHDVIRGLVLDGQAITHETMASAYPAAPMRYHTIGLHEFVEETAQYREISLEELQERTYIAKDGLWFMDYEKPAKERAADVTIGWAEGAHLWVVKPLLAGGAHVLHYDGERLESVEVVDGRTYDREKARVEAMMAPPRRRSP